MPHGIDDDMGLDELNNFEFPLPTGDEGRGYAKRKIEQPFVPLTQAAKVLRTPERVADEVSKFHNALVANLTQYYSVNGQREVMISVLTQDFLHSLLHQ